MKVDLRNKLSGDGTVTFLHVDWRAPDSRLGILFCRFAASDHEVGLRIDFDKRAVFDRIDDAQAARLIGDRMPEICSLVALERAKMTAV